MARWYFSAGSNSARIGPLDDNAASAHAQQHPEDFCWREGFAAWQPVGDVAELNATRATAPPSMPALPSTGSGGGRDDEIDYRLVRSHMQFVEVELHPGARAIAEAGPLRSKEAAGQIDTKR